MFPVETGCWGFPAQSAWVLLSALGLDKLLVGWGRRQNEPRVGFGVGKRRKAGGQEQVGSELATHCRPTNWRVLRLRVKTLSEGCAKT